MSNANHDFVILNKEGTKFIKIDNKLMRKPFMRMNQCQKMIHSLSSMNYLKIEEENLLAYEDLSNE